ncbi:MAG TPA: hypothetical protein VK171_05850 [Fimbriimonas sp.]|nr:hypothetical protein [Fimbriimonas sp.]
MEFQQFKIDLPSGLSDTSSAERELMELASFIPSDIVSALFREYVDRVKPLEQFMTRELFGVPCIAGFVEGRKVGFGFYGFTAEGVNVFLEIGCAWQVYKNGNLKLNLPGPEAVDRVRKEMQRTLRELGLHRQDGGATLPA